jgi:hypothetical protein
VIDETLAGFLGVRRGADDVEDLLVAEHARKAVGAEQVDVAGEGVLGLDVDLDDLHRPHGAGDDVPRQSAELLRGHVRPSVEGLVEQRVIARHLHQLAVAEAIAPAVADVRDVRHAFGQVERHAGGAHPAVLRVALGEGMHVAVGGGHARSEATRTG